MDFFLRLLFVVIVLFPSSSCLFQEEREESKLEKTAVFHPGTLLGYEFNYYSGEYCYSGLCRDATKVEVEKAGFSPSDEVTGLHERTKTFSGKEYKEFISWGESEGIFEAHLKFKKKIWKRGDLRNFIKSLKLSDPIRKYSSKGFLGCYDQFYPFLMHEEKDHFVIRQYFKDNSFEIIALYRCGAAKNYRKKK